MKGLFVTGTDTGVGKTVITAAVAAALRAGGVDAGICKPVQSGHRADDPDGDTSRLLAWSGVGDRPEQVNLYALEAPLAPLVAARGEGIVVEPDAVLRHVRAAGRLHEVLLVEGAGGFLVPLAERWTVADLAGALGMPVLIVARPGLGTVNHTLLTAMAVRQAGLEVAGVVLNAEDAGTGASRHTNRSLIEEFGGGRVLGVTPRLTGPLTGRRLRAMINDHMDLAPLRRLLDGPLEVPAAGGSRS